MGEHEVQELRWSPAVVADPQGPYRLDADAEVAAGRAVHPVS